jgi:hypothetical protein
VELGEVQLFRLQVPGGTTRGRGRVRNVRQGAGEADPGWEHPPKRQAGRGGHWSSRAGAGL